jgi:adenine phosphoribosyltransferase
VHTVRKYSFHRKLLSSIIGYAVLILVISRMNHYRTGMCMNNQIFSYLVCASLLLPISASAKQEQQTATFEVKVGAYAKQYPIIAAPGDKNSRLAYLYDLNDNYELATQMATELSSQIQKSGILQQVSVLVMPGDKANMMGTLLMEKLQQLKPSLKFCIIRSTAKGGSFKSIEYQSITSADKKSLHLRQDQYDTVKNNNVLIFDDVISTGATLNAVKDLLAQANATVVGYACFATEGKTPITSFNDKPLFKITHLPLLPAKQENAKS